MKRKLLFRLILTFVIFALISFGIISTFIAQYNQENMITTTAESLKKESSSIANSYGDNFLSEKTSLAEFQKQLSVISDYLDADILVIDRDGRILVDSNKYISPNEEIYIEGFDILNYGSNNYLTDDFFGYYDKNVLSTFSTFASGYSNKTYVFINKPISKISEAQYSMLNGSYISMIIMLVLALICFIFYFLSVYVPLNKLYRSMKRFSKGDFSETINMERNDEIGEIADTVDYMASELNSLEDDQRKFISNISHDFRSPLTSIKGYAEAMRDGVIPPEFQEKYLNVIVFETERLEKLTHEILDLNKYGKHGSYLDLTRFDLNALIRQTLLTFEGRCSEKRLTVDLILTGETMYVVADQSKIGQVLHNLIDNAIKFSNEGTKLVVETNVNSSKVFTSIKDRGIGIPKDSISKVWERFYKTDLSRGKDKKGTGLGLAIVKDIINAHGENINVVSTVGVGTAFTFSLPRAEE